MKKLNLLAAAGLVTLGLTACNQQPAASGDNSAAAAVKAPNGDWSQLVTQTAEGGMLMGNPNAKVKVVEFASMTCPHCADFSRDGKPKLVDQYVKTGNVSFEFRNLVANGLDITASLIARCAGASPQFFTLTDGLFADQKSFFDRLGAVPQDQVAAIGSLPPAQQFQRMAELSGLREWAAQRGVPSARANQCVANQTEIDRLVQMTSDASSQYEIPGTPAFLVNGELVQVQPGQSNWTRLEEEIKSAL